MDSGFIALSVFLIAALSFVMLPGIIKVFIKTKSNPLKAIKNPSIKFGTFYIYTLSLIIIVYVCNTSSFNPNRDKNDIIENADREGIFEHQYWAYSEKLKINPNDYRSRYYMHLAHFRSEEERSFWEQKPEYIHAAIPSGYDYDELIKSDNVQLRERGYLGAAIMQKVYYRNNETALKFLDSLKSQNMPFVQCLKAICSPEGNIKRQYCINEISNKGYISEAVKEYADYCYNQDDFGGFETFYANTKFRPLIPAHIKQWYAFKTLRFHEVYIYEFEWIFKNTTAFVVFSSLFIFFIWFYFLYAIDLFEKEKTKYLFFAVLLSFLCFTLYPYLHFAATELLGMGLNHSSLNNLFYCVFKIGLSEEIIKIVPLVLILRFTKIINEPIDYLLYAGIGALTFSVLEDFRYFNTESVRNVYSRGIFTSISHIADSSFPAYGLVLANYFYKRYKVLLFFVGLVFASIAHGVYDFFIIDESFSLWIIPFLILLMQVWWFVHIANNCLNNSLHFNKALTLNTSNLSIIVCGGLFMTIMTTYLHIAVEISPEYATWQLFIALIFYSYILFFFSVCINRIDVLEGQWNKFSFKHFIDPKVFFAGIHHKYWTLPGRKILIYASGKQTKILSHALPLETNITSRHKIGNYTGWFCIDLNYPISLNGIYISKLYMRTKQDNEPIFEEARNFVAIYISKKPTEVNPKDLLFVDWVSLKLL